MKVLKTIIASAVIVFALTTVAMASVQHFTKQSGQAAGSQAQAAQPTYTVTLTAAQLAQLMRSSQVVTTGEHARHTLRHDTAARHHTSSHHTSTDHAGDATHASPSGSGGTYHYEAPHHASSSTSSSGRHHAETSHHSGDCGGGGDCGD